MENSQGEIYKNLQLLIFRSTTENRQEYKWYGVEKELLKRS